MYPIFKLYIVPLSRGVSIALVQMKGYHFTYNVFNCSEIIIIIFKLFFYQTNEAHT